MEASPRRARGFSRRSVSLRTARQDARAGLINALVSVPDGLAAAALAGVTVGLYTSATGPIAGSALASSHRMQIATTWASVLAADRTRTTALRQRSWRG
jgi:SulP family sulfate permease